LQAANIWFPSAVLLLTVLPGPTSMPAASLGEAYPNRLQKWRIEDKRSFRLINTAAT
jgi:hypothetical protein